MAPLLIILYLIGITPLRLSVFFRYPGERPARFCLRVWGLRLPERRGRLAAGRQGLPRAWPMIRAVFRHVTLCRLDVWVRVGGDAARAALITGLLRALDGATTRTQIHCVPGFGEKGTLRAGCILDARLGILLFAALAGRIARTARRKKEAGA